MENNKIEHGTEKNSKKEHGAREKKQEEDFSVFLSHSFNQLNGKPS